MTELKVGDAAPEFEALTDANARVKLTDFRGKRVVLYFYPKDDTPGCTAQACSLRDSYADIEARNAIVLGVSPDGVESHQNFKTKFQLPFPLLADPDHSIADRYGVWGERSFQGRTYMGINRSHFVIDEQGRLVDVVYGVRPVETASKSLEVLV